MRRIVVTPAGRQRYLEILLVYVERAKQSGAIDEWHLWLNTNVESDVAYIRGLAASRGPWLKVIELDAAVREVSIFNIFKFFKHAMEEDCVYVRLDDDVVYVEPDFFEKFIRFRLEHREPFLVYGNIINNAVISHLHQRNGRFQFPVLGGYECMDAVGWKTPPYAEAIHRAFLADLRAGALDKWRRSFSEWHCLQFERVSINCVAWLGATFREFNAEVGTDEEQWLSVDKPAALGPRAHNVIYGDAIVAHFSFFPQRPHLDGTDILQQYKQLAEDLAR